MSLFLYLQDVISLGVGISQIVLLILSVMGLAIARLSLRYEQIAIFRRPMSIAGLSLPAAVACLAIFREPAGREDEKTCALPVTLAELGDDPPTKKLQTRQRFIRGRVK